MPKNSTLKSIKIEEALKKVRIKNRIEYTGLFDKDTSELFTKSKLINIRCKNSIIEKFSEQWDLNP